MIDRLDEALTHFTQCLGCGHIFDRDDLALYGGRCRACGFAEDGEDEVAPELPADVEPRDIPPGHNAALRALLRRQT